MSRHIYEHIEQVGVQYFVFSVRLLYIQTKKIVFALISIDIEEIFMASLYTFVWYISG